MDRDIDESTAVRRSIRAVTPTTRARFWARRAARRDARIGVVADQQSSLAGDRTVWTPFIAEVIAAAAEVDAQARARLQRRNRELTDGIYRRAQAVVFQHDSNKHRDTAHHRRLAKALGLWSIEVADARSLVKASVEQYNQLISLYWGRLCELEAATSDRHRTEGLRPARAELDQIWQDPIALLPDDPPPRPPMRSPLTRALEIVRPLVTAS
jgi:hypothetical protein